MLAGRRGNAFGKIKKKTGGDWGHSRTSVISPFDRAHTTSYSLSIESIYLSSYISIFYRLWDITSYLSKVENFSYHTCICWCRWEYQDLWHQKTTVPGLSCLFASWCLIERPLVTDGRTDGQTLNHSTYLASIASRGKKRLNRSSHNQRCLIAYRHANFLTLKVLLEFYLYHPTEARKAGGSKNRRFSNNILLYLSNGSR